MKIGKVIKRYRVDRNLTQQQLAGYAEVSVSYLSLLERDKRDPPLSTIEKVAYALNVPVFILMFLAEDTDGKSGLSQELREKIAYEALKW